MDSSTQMNWVLLNAPAFAVEVVHRSLPVAWAAAPGGWHLSASIVSVKAGFAASISPATCNWESGRVQWGPWVLFYMHLCGRACGSKCNQHGGGWLVSSLLLECLLNCSSSGSITDLWALQ